MLTNTLKIRPRRCTSRELEKVGVVLFDKYGVRLARSTCGREWSTNLQ